MGSTVLLCKACVQRFSTYFNYFFTFSFYFSSSSRFTLELRSREASNASEADCWATLLGSSFQTKEDFSSRVLSGCSGPGVARHYAVSLFMVSRVSRPPAPLLAASLKPLLVPWKSVASRPSFFKYLVHECLIMISPTYIHRSKSLKAPFISSTKIWNLLIHLIRKYT